MIVIRGLGSKFSNDQSGTVAVIFGVSCLFLMMFAFLAIDTSRFHDVSSRMQSALDASVLAGAKLLDDDTSTDALIQERAQAYFSAAMTNLGASVTSIAPLAVTIDRPTSTVSATVQARMPSFFGSLTKQSPLTIINQTSKVVYAMQPIELAMVLDITGSMNNNNKLADMKIAAKDVIDTLYATALSDSTVRIAVVPWSASVNAGALDPAVSTAPPPTVICKYKGENCEDVSGAAVDTCVIERTGANAATDAAPVGADKLPSVPTIPYGKYVCPPSTVIPLTGKSDVATIKSTIDGYVAAGSTAGHIGTAWGWYMLSPDWAGVLPAASQPKPYNDNGTMKAMIIMTDGLFNTSYLNGSATPDAQQSTESYQQFDALCAGIKGKGIMVYTVGFDLSDPTALSKLQGCASGATNFFDAKTGADLKKAFSDIASKLTTMRVAG